MADRVKRDWDLDRAADRYFAFEDIADAMEEETTSIAGRREGLQKLRGVEAWCKELLQAIARETPWVDTPYLESFVAKGWPADDRLRALLTAAEEAKRDA